LLFKIQTYDNRAGPILFIVYLFKNCLFAFSMFIGFSLFLICISNENTTKAVQKILSFQSIGKGS